MVRMAQDWSLRVPLVDGSRQLRLARRRRRRRVSATPSAGSRRSRWSCSRELDSRRSTCAPNYDGTHRGADRAAGAVPEPARQRLDRHRGRHGDEHPAAQPRRGRRRADRARRRTARSSTSQLMKHIKGPDFPTGGQMLNSKVELRQIYEDGAGHDPGARRVQARGEEAAAAPTSSSRRSRTR